MICKCQSSDGTNHANFRQTKSRHGNGISPNKTAMPALFAKYLRSLKITGVHLKASFCERYHSSTEVGEATWLVISLLPILKPKRPDVQGVPERMSKVIVLFQIIKNIFLGQYNDFLGLLGDI